jgi:hypothetical protein
MNLTLVSKKAHNNFTLLFITTTDNKRTAGGLIWRTPDFRISAQQRALRAIAPFRTSGISNHQIRP